ncbi:MAG: glycosyltransferase [Deltaproteobacteria bacterium]|nr:glycosyltransferase [Deltaproteobacteria bacterium]
MSIKVQPPFPSELELLIPPEIKDDEFYHLIIELSKREHVTTVLEIGSSAGGGSTEAFVMGLRDNPNKPELYCLEISAPRFVKLRQRYTDETFVKCYNVSSVPTSVFPSDDDVVDFYRDNSTALNRYSIETVLGWLRQDVEYIKKAGVSEEGIELIKKENNIEVFDMVLIDGSEFTGTAELNRVYGAGLILLDDVNSYKNFNNFIRLGNDPQYEMIHCNTKLRNGYAIFKRIDVPAEDESNSCNNAGNIEALIQLARTYKAQGRETEALKILENSLSVYPESQAIINEIDKCEGCLAGQNLVARPEMKADLPVHFFTIVLNGEPFIRYHIEIFKQLKFKWHWHVIEGVAALKNDTAWCVANGGRITDELHAEGLSKDKTTQYLDQLFSVYPDQVTVYRKSEGRFWHGKLEMVNAPLPAIKEECLLWQIDADELWTVSQINRARELFMKFPDRTAAYYWCWFFVGMDIVISTRNCYAQNPKQEWLRTWRYRPGCRWMAHEPPVLVEPVGENRWRDLGRVKPFSHQETERAGLIFQHFAYVTREQLIFKEIYYGYSGATEKWEELQENTEFPILLKDYFPWVRDETQVNRASALSVHPLAWYQRGGKYSETVIIDGVFFQLYRTGIARVWQSLFECWAKTPFAQRLLVLDRARTVPRVPGLRYREIAPYNYNNTDADRFMLEQICCEENAAVFVSTYYTTPLATPSVFLGHDMIPELGGWDLNKPMWREKHHGIRHADRYVVVSKNTAKDLRHFFPGIHSDKITVSHNGVAFSRPAGCEVEAFKQRYGIKKPYWLVIGAKISYKNSILFFEAFSLLREQRQNFSIVCTGRQGEVESIFAEYAGDADVFMLYLSDEELAAAYAGAIALVYPSLYEGFGMPIVEAMACGCPVITSPNGSIPEVGGDAVLYVDSGDVEAMRQALEDIQARQLKEQLVEKGLKRSTLFSWEKMAEDVKTVLLLVADTEVGWKFQCV